jgi:hypothetical protein
MKRVFLYGIAGAEDNYRIVRYIFIDGAVEPITITNIARTAGWLKFKNPGIEHVYAIDESVGLARAYKSAKKNDSIANNVEFKLILEREGLQII